MTHHRKHSTTNFEWPIYIAAVFCGYIAAHTTYHSQTIHHKSIVKIYETNVLLLAYFNGYPDCIMKWSSTETLQDYKLPESSVVGRPKHNTGPYKHGRVIIQVSTYLLWLSTPSYHSHTRRLHRHQSATQRNIHAIHPIKSPCILHPPSTCSPPFFRQWCLHVSHHRNYSSTLLPFQHFLAFLTLTTSPQTHRLFFSRYFSYHRSGPHTTPFYG